MTTSITLHVERGERWRIFGRGSASRATAGAAGTASAIRSVCSRGLLATASSSSRAGGNVFQRTNGRVRFERRGAIGGEPAAILGQGADELYAALHDGTIKRSIDGGATWTRCGRARARSTGPSLAAAVVVVTESFAGGLPRRQSCAMPLGGFRPPTRG